MHLFESKIKKQNKIAGVCACTQDGVKFIICSSVLNCRKARQFLHKYPWNLLSPGCAPAAPPLSRSWWRGPGRQEEG